MKYTLAHIAANPRLFRFEVGDQDKFVLRPLEPVDAMRLSAFLGNLSNQTRRAYDLKSYDMEMAQEMCDAINRYDKLRFILIEQRSSDCVGLIEYSLDNPISDVLRFNKYGLQLDNETDCRIGPCIADDFQSCGLGTTLLPLCKHIARQLGKQRIILWGGVRTDNVRAIAYYKKCGFQSFGEFVDHNKIQHFDMMLVIGES